MKKEKVKGEIKILGIYKISNITNNKIYIGSSSFVQSRLRLHKSHLNQNIHSNKHLQSSYNKYGKDSFSFELIEECKIEDLVLREQYWIDLLDACNNKKGYNKRLIAESNNGLKRSEETKRKISESKKGKRYLSDEHYEKLAENKRGESNIAAIEYYASLSDEEKSERGKHANLGRQQKAKERGSYNTLEGQISYKKKRGRKIYKYDENFNLVKEYLCISDALKDLGMSTKNTSCITNQLDTNKLYKGFIWNSIERTNGDISNELGELLENLEVDNQQLS